MSITTKGREQQERAVPRAALFCWKVLCLSGIEKNPLRFNDSINGAKGYNALNVSALRHFRINPSQTASRTSGTRPSGTCAGSTVSRGASSRTRRQAATRYVAESRVDPDYPIIFAPYNSLFAPQYFLIRRHGERLSAVSLQIFSAKQSLRWGLGNGDQAGRALSGTSR